MISIVTDKIFFLKAAQKKAATTDKVTAQRGGGVHGSGRVGQTKN